MIGRTFAIAFVYIVSHHISHVEGNGYTAAEVNKLKARLFDGYNRNTAPGGSENVHVNADVMIRSISDLDERLEKLTTVLHLFLDWQDASFTWNPADFSDIHHINMGREEVWVPEFFVFNQHHHIDYGIEEKRFMPVKYDSKGNGHFAQTITAETSCDLDTSGFPFDRHTCKIEFMCSKDNVTVESAFQEHILIAFEPDGSWDVTDATTENESHFDISISITLARKPTFVLVNLIVPMTLLALISPMVFLLPNQSGERVGFSITVLLATSVFMTIVADNVPAKSKPFPLILTMLFISYSLTVAVVMVVIINARVYCLPDTMPIPRPLLWLLKSSRRLYCCFRRRSTRGKSHDDDGNCEERAPMGEGELIGKGTGKNKVWTWKDVGTGIDIFFLTFLYTTKFTLLVAFMVILKSKDSALLQNTESESKNY